MKLKKFRKNRKQKGIAIGCVITLLLTIVGINIYRTFALYKEEKTFNVLRGTVPDFTHVTITYKVNGSIQSTPPTKSSNYSISVSCSGASGSWDSTNWKLKVTNKTKKDITCTVTFTRTLYKDSILNGADPVISGDLIPVKISTSGTVTKADTYSEWYNYKNKQWANAIIPTDSAKTTVKNYSAGTTISESQIESYFVWIPKYKYKLFDEKLGLYSSRTGKQDKNNKAIDIVFGTTNTSDSYSGQCTTPQTSGSSGSCVVGDYMTHPAFLAFGVKGLWIGKFETGYRDATSASDAEKNTADSTKLVVKPNIYAWRKISIANAYNTSLNYKTTLKSHMMKNTEWGAVAYLTQSIYGRCSSSTSCTEVTINGINNHKTGYTDSSTTYPTSKNASTTGNNTGIYDMSGGSYEFVMGVLYSSSGDKPLYSSSGFTASTFPTDSKYFDKYNYSTGGSNYTGRILGDATGEMGPFDTSPAGSYFGDGAGYAQASSYPWFTRGGRYTTGTGAGIFNMYRGNGAAEATYTFRVVLAV